MFPEVTDDQTTTRCESAPQHRQQLVATRQMHQHEPRVDHVIRTTRRHTVVDVMSQNRDAVARRYTADIQIRGNNRPTWTHAGRELRGDRTVSGPDLDARVPGDDPRLLPHRLAIAVVRPN